MITKDLLGEAKGNSSLQEKGTKEQNIFIGEITAILFSPGRHKKSEFRLEFLSKTLNYCCYVLRMGHKWWSTVL